MKLIRSGAGDNVDYASGRATSLWSITVGLDCNLLNAFDVRLHSYGPDDSFIVVNSINHPIIKRVVLPVHGNAGRIGSPIVGSTTG